MDDCLNLIKNMARFAEMDIVSVDRNWVIRDLEENFSGHQQMAWNWGVGQSIQEHLLLMDDSRWQVLDQELQQGQMQCLDAFLILSNQLKTAVTVTFVLNPALSPDLIQLWIRYPACPDAPSRSKSNDDLEQKLSQVFAQIKELVYITDHQGRIEYVNPAFETVTGYAAEEMVGQFTRKLKGEVLKQDQYESLWHTILSGNVWRGLLKNRKKNGQYYLQETIITPIFNERGTIINFAAVGWDATWQHKLEKRMQETQKLEVLGTMASGISHEFNNLIFTIRGHVELMQLQPNIPPSQLEAMDRITQAVDRARALIQQIMSFSRSRADKPQPIKILPLIKELSKLFQSRLEEGIELHLTCEQEPESILADPGQIHQVCLNLFNFLADWMKKEGGTIEVVLNRIQLNPVQASELNLNSGGFNQISITSNGPHLDDETLKRLFDPGFSGAQDIDNFGMGLYLAHSIIASMQGSVQVSNLPERGNRFDLYLPIHNVQAESENLVTEQEAGPPHSGNPRILLVDDEKIILEMITQQLKRMGFEVSAFQNPLQAWEHFQQQPDYDLVLTDFTMPQLTGDELAQKIINKQPDIPVLIITAYGHLISEEKLKHIGVLRCLSKPISAGKLRRIINDVLEMRSRKKTD